MFPLLMAGVNTPGIPLFSLQSAWEDRCLVLRFSLIDSAVVVVILPRINLYFGWRASDEATFRTRLWLWHYPLGTGISWGPYEGS